MFSGDSAGFFVPCPLEMSLFYSTFKTTTNTLQK